MIESYRIAETSVVIVDKFYFAVSRIFGVRKWRRCVRIIEIPKTQALMMIPTSMAPKVMPSPDFTMVLKSEKA